MEEDREEFLEQELEYTDADDPQYYLEPSHSREDRPHRIE